MGLIGLLSQELQQLIKREFKNGLPVEITAVKWRIPTEPLKQLEWLYASEDVILI